MKNLNNLKFVMFFFLEHLGVESAEYNSHIKLCCKLNSSFPVDKQRYNELLNTLEINK